MNSQRFRIKIDLNLEAVTCPGVWLCTHGYLEITIKVLGYFFRTGAMEPLFPLLCHDHFEIHGYFKHAKSIAQLINNISREILEITLWQNSRRLAYYEGVLMDLLHYIEPKLQCPHTNMRQLLMKTTAAFPGIIAPKVEISSQFLIKDTILNLYNTSEDLKTCANIMKNPQGKSKLGDDRKPTQYQRPCIEQTLTLEYLTNSQNRIRKQKPVCHARDFMQRSKQLLNDFISIEDDKGQQHLLSSCSSDKNTHTSMGICDIEHDGDQWKFDHNHEKFCQLCRLYKELFLK